MTPSADLDPRVSSLTQMRAHLRLPSVLVSLGLALAACGGDGDAPAETGAATTTPERTAAWVADASTYTPEQAERGAQVFLDICSACHALDEFRQPTFHRLWYGRSVEDFYRFVSMEMPYNAPASLESRDYADVLAFIFRENAMPAGDEELPPDPDRLREIDLRAPSE